MVCHSLTWLKRNKNVLSILTKCQQFPMPHLVFPGRICDCYFCSSHISLFICLLCNCAFPPSLYSAGLLVWAIWSDLHYMEDWGLCLPHHHCTCFLQFIACGTLSQDWSGESWLEESIAKLWNVYKILTVIQNLVFTFLHFCIQSSNFQKFENLHLVSRGFLPNSHFSPTH